MDTILLHLLRIIIKKSSMIEFFLAVFIDKFVTSTRGHSIHKLVSSLSEHRLS